MSVLQLDSVPTARAHPRTCTPLANATADDDTWNGDGNPPITLTADCVLFDVCLDKAAYLCFAPTTSDPAQNGCIYPAGRHSFKVSAPTYLHYKNGAAGENVTVGVNCWAEGG